MVLLHSVEDSDRLVEDGFGIIFNLPSFQVVAIPGVHSLWNSAESLLYLPGPSQFGRLWAPTSVSSGLSHCQRLFDSSQL